MTQLHPRAVAPPLTQDAVNLPPDTVDGVALVRGASRGFTVLVAGGLGAPLGAMVPVVGPFVLVGVAVVAFAVAGASIGSSSRTAVHGALAATLSYLLVSPLVLFAQGGFEMRSTLLTGLLAVVVGAVGGAVAGRAGRRGVR